jgi:hypothetical protein
VINRGVAGLVLVLLLAFPGVPAASVVTADASSDVDVKAAFLYNFARFAEWPSLAGGSLFLCVVGDDRIAAALARLTQGKVVEGRAIDVRRTPAADGQPCHLLFISQSSVRTTSTLLADCMGQPVLTVGDAERFASSGGMIELFTEKGRMRFAINVDAIQRSPVKVSSRLLSLANIVRDGS